MKLIIQIPCYNEEGTLGATLGDLPRAIPGIDKIETLIINDGSEDDTVEVARSHGVDHIVELPCHKGLGPAWSAGIDASLREGADIIVNTDGDNQYNGADIAQLVQPILDGEAEIVIGARPIEQIEHFSRFKKRLQRVGSWIVSRFAGVDVPDATSGFRAYTRDAALMLNVLSQYSHITETIIRAARKGMTIKSVPIRVNEKLRESRLITSMPGYVWRQAGDIFRVFTMVRPLKVFILTSSVLLLLGLAGCVRFLVFFIAGNGSGHVQSLLLSATLIILAFLIGMVGLTADMISGNHRLIEDVLYRLRKLEIHNHRPQDSGDKADS